MKEYIYESITNCCNAFQELLLLDKYITKKMYDSFADKYQDTFKIVYKKYITTSDVLYKKIMSIVNNGYQIIETRNKKYVEEKLESNKEYFDNMFKGIDDSILLDDEQRRAIVTDENYSLIIAGAGCGKTTTMAAKVKYLIEKCNIKKERIILLAYTNKAMLELDQRINKDFNLGVEVLTFHKLGMQFVRKLFDKPVQVVTDATMYEYIKEYVTNEIFPNKEKLKYFINSFKEYVYFDSKVYDYDAFDEYFKYYADKRYEENKNDLYKYIIPRIESRTKNFRSINGESLKSLGETVIANYLYLNGYDYKYEKAYPHKLDHDRSYSPDFTINQDGLTVYVEYYGLTTLRKDGTYTTNDIKMYNKLIDKKRVLHKKYNTDLIELYSKVECGISCIDILEKELIKRGLKPQKKTKKEVFYRLLNTSKEAEYFNYINLTSSFINRFKEKGYSDKDFDYLISHEYREDIKKQLMFTRDVYRYYQDRLHKEYKVDFNDMINFAYRGMEKIKHDYKNLDYDYLIIDEYQDISKQRYNFAKKLSDLFNAKIVAVGDDWQAIYGFSGSDVELFSRFYNIMGYADIARITTTYRNSQELVDVASTFVSKNTDLFSKTLVSTKHLENPIEINYYDESNPDSKYNIINRIIKNIYLKNKNAKILILGRYKDDINPFIDSGHFKKGPHDKVICKEVYQADIDYLTIHKAKGLGYDQVILINAVNSLYGFPSQIEDEPLLKVLNPIKQELIEYPEERRLFYVALTRTKNKLFILCPYYPITDRSSFIREISNNPNVLERVEI